MNSSECRERFSDHLAQRDPIQFSWYCSSSRVMYELFQAISRTLLVYAQSIWCYGRCWRVTDGATCKEETNLVASVSITDFRTCDPGSAHSVVLFVFSGTSCYNTVSGPLFALPWLLSILIAIKLITYCSPVLCFLLLWLTGRA
jgi:hypothetical protein